MNKTKIPNAGFPIWIGAGMIFLLVAAVYWPVFYSGFVWDDNSMLTANPFVKARDGLRYIWFSTGPVDYFPLTYTSLWLEWRLWGMHATGYHVTNVLLHAAASVFLWRIFKHLKLPGAFLAALVFALHPVNVESVAWIAERKNTLCMFFYMLSLLFFSRSENKNPMAANSFLNRPAFQYGLSVIFFLLALLSKTAVVTFPVVLLLYAWWRRAALTDSLSHSPTSPLSRRDLIRTVPFFALSLALGLATVWFQHHRAIADDVIREAGFWTRIGDAGLAIWFYLFKAVFPVRLSFVYPEWDISARPVWSALAWLALFFCGALFWWKRRAWGRHALFALGYFVLLLLPVLGFLNIYFHRYSLVADHWQYFALPGIIALIVSSVAHFLPSRPGPQQWGIQAAALGALALLGFATGQQAMIYKNPETLWRDTLEKNPNAWLALNNLGLTLEEKGKINEAIALFEKSLRLKPHQVEGRNNLGSALLNQGRLDEAAAQYQIALKINPNFATTRYNIANVLDQQGKPEESIAEYRQALRLNPAYVDAHNNLGCMLILQGKRDEGVAHLREALRLNPDNLDSLNNLGSTLTESGQPREALPLLRRALQLNPAYAEAHYNLGSALLDLGELLDATEHFAAALKVNPNAPMAHYKSGEAFFRGGKTNEALAHFQAALKLDPDLPEAQYQAAVILSEGKNFASAIAHFKEAIRLNPDWVEPLNNLAWLRATCPEEKWRDGKQAIELAQRACALTENKNPGALDTLAAAHARAGQFSQAVATAEKARALAAAAGQTEVASQIQDRLNRYQSQLPYHEK